MKTLVQKPTSILWVVLVGLLAFTSFDSKAQQAEVSFQIFYDELAPHGRWLLHPKYGDVWAPNVQGEFTPYLTNGYWTVTQYGNTWVSNYDWGWATFHYGRWYFDEFEGWVWIPDTEWAPAWVVWRNGGGYYGWAAMSPGINFNVSFTLFDGIPGNYWCFVPQQYVWRPYLYRYCAPRHRNVYIVSNTTYVSHCRVNNITYNYYTGPSHTEITYVTNRPVVIHQVEHTNKPGRSQVSRDKIAMYTPIVKRNEINRPALGTLGSNNGWGKGPVRGGNNNGGNGSGNDQGNNGNGNNGGQGNNGHGNGDQDAPGNSGGNNNGENSENSGQGNSGKGKGGNNSSRWSNSNSSDRTSDSNDNFENWKRSENNNVRSYRSTEIKKSSNTSAGNNNRSSWSNSGGSNRSFSSGNSGNSGGNTKSYTPSRSSSSSSGNRTYTPSSSGNSGSSGKSYTPSRSSGSSGNSNRSITPGRSSGSTSGVSKMVTPSRSSGSNSNSSPKSKSKN